MNSPVAFFAYNRPCHTFKTLKSLSENVEAIETELYVFIDGHKKNSEMQLVDNVEKIINSFGSKFKSIKIERSEINLTGGLSQKRGISKVLSIHESVICLEDDIYVSKQFLFYMNNALKTYKNQKKIWHINGFNHPIKIKADFDCFFMRAMISWGWGTWKDRWNNFMENPLSCDPYYLKETFTKKMINEFDLKLKISIFWSQVEANASGELSNTWDIFWYSHIFLNKGLCLTPKISLTRNIGHDGSGIHTGYDKELLSSVIDDKKITNFPIDFEENEECIRMIGRYFSKKYSFLSRLKNKINLLFKFLVKLF